MARDSEPPLAARRAIRVADGMGQFVICRAGGREGGREGGCSHLNKLSMRLSEGQASVLMCGV